MISTQTFQFVVLSWTAIAVLLFPVLLKITAPYGRHSKNTWGPSINNHMGWFIMEFPALFLFGSLVILGGGLENRIVAIPFLLWMIHYINRTLIFPFRIKTNLKEMPVVIVAMAFFFNLVNGFINGYGLGFMPALYSDAWLADPRFIIGTILFVGGFCLNFYSDNLLFRLRQKNSSYYSIPRGGLFRYVSCPNFLGEIIEWGGFALLTWSLPGLSFFIWTAVNLIPRALDHHKWYKSHFTDYPAERKAVFPFIL